MAPCCFFQCPLLYGLLVYLVGSVTTTMRMRELVALLFVVFITHVLSVIFLYSLLK